MAELRSDQDDQESVMSPVWGVVGESKALVGVMHQSRLAGAERCCIL